MAIDINSTGITLGGNTFNFLLPMQVRDNQSIIPSTKPLYKEGSIFLTDGVISGVYCRYSGLPISILPGEYRRLSLDVDIVSGVLQVEAVPPSILISPDVSVIWCIQNMPTDPSSAPTLWSMMLMIPANKVDVI